MTETQRILRGLSWRLKLAHDRTARLKWHFKRFADITQNGDSNPTIAVVVVGRNDNYGGDFRSRLNTTLEWNLGYTFSEAIYVEWNPIPDKPSDASWLVERFKNMRVYIVSPDRHRRCCSNPSMPMMEYFAKNVGIRRASSSWICLVNADVLIGPEVFERFKKLRRDRVYGTHSANIRWNGASIGATDLSERSTLIGGFSATPDLFSVAGNFVLAHRDLWHHGRGYDESLTDRRVVCDAHGVAQLYNLGAKPRVLGQHYHLDHPESCRNAIQDHQGKYFDPWEGIPYHNGDDWGQADARERLIGERTYYLD
jgi:hypothetical protein